HSILAASRLIPGAHAIYQSYEKLSTVVNTRHQRLVTGVTANPVIPHPLELLSLKSCFSLRQQGTFLLLWYRCAATRSATIPPSLEMQVSNQAPRGVVEWTSCFCKRSAEFGSR